MEVLLDGSFMLNSLKNKVDFLEELANLGFVAKVPREVLQELKDKKTNAQFHNRVLIEQLFELLEKRGVKKMSLGTGKVDEQLIKYGKKGIYIATTDSGIRRLVPNKIVLSLTTKKISVERS